MTKPKPRPVDPEPADSGNEDPPAPSGASSSEPRTPEPAPDSSGAGLAPPPVGEQAQVWRERDEYLELAQRTQADFENYRKRVAKETQDAEARGRASLARELLTVADNLERALDASEPGNPLANGVRLVYEDLAGALERAGVEGYEPSGEVFDPEHHEAVLTQPVPANEDGRIIDVHEKGYRLDGQVLRPARVTVGKAR